MKLRYSAKKISDNKWLITGEKWDSCYCDKEPFSIEIEKERRPVKRDIVNYI